MYILLLLLTLFLVRFIWPLVRVAVGIHRQVRAFQKNQQPQAPSSTSPSPSSRSKKGEYIDFEEVR